MPYSKFTLSRAVEDFGLTVREQSNLFAAIQPVVPTPLLRDLLVENVPWAVAFWIIRSTIGNTQKFQLP